MKDNIFRGRTGRDLGLKTIDTSGTTPCASNDPKVREASHCSAFGAKGKTAASKPASAKTTKAASAITTGTTAKSKASSSKAATGLKAAVAYDNSVGGANDLPPVGKMTTGKSTAKKATTAKSTAAKTTAKKATGTATAKSTAKKSTASTKKTAPKKSTKTNNDDYVLVEEVIIVEEYL